MKFKDIYKEYIEYLKIKEKETSIMTIEQRFKNILPYFQNYRIEEIKPIIYLQWQKEINKKDYSISYKNILHNEMCRIYNFINLFYDYNKKIPKMVGKFKNNELDPQRQIWCKEEFNNFINVITNEEEKIFFEVLWYTGAREGEIFALNWNDVHEDYVRINKTITKRFINGKRQIQSPKTKYSNANIIIDKTLYYKLMELKKNQNIKYNDFKNDYFVFGGIKPFNPSTIERHKNNYCKLAKVKQIQIKEFRHSHASYMYYITKDMNLVKKRLRHASIITTMEVYTHLIDVDKKRELNALEELRNY